MHLIFSSNFTVESGKFKSFLSSKKILKFYNFLLIDFKDGIGDKIRFDSSSSSLRLSRLLIFLLFEKIFGKFFLFSSSNFFLTDINKVELILSGTLLK